LIDDNLSDGRESRTYIVGSGAKARGTCPNSDKIEYLTGKSGTKTQARCRKRWKWCRKSFRGWEWGWDTLISPCTVHVIHKDLEPKSLWYVRHVTMRNPADNVTIVGCQRRYNSTLSSLDDPRSRGPNLGINHVTYAISLSIRPTISVLDGRFRWVLVLDNTGFSCTGFTSATPKSAL
jgi:hypothetical protein